MTIDPNLINYWIHSPQEDQDEIITYRKKKSVTGNANNNTSNGFELKENGEFIKYTNSPEGILKSHSGHYQVYNKSIIVNFDDPYQDFILKIEYLDDNVLKVRKS